MIRKLVQGDATHGDAVLCRSHLSKGLAEAIGNEDTVPLEVSGSGGRCGYRTFDSTFEQVHLVAIAIAEHGLGRDPGVAQPCHETGETILFQLVPEDLGQAGRQSVESAQVKACVLDEQWAADGSKGLDQLVLDQGMNVVSLQLLDLLWHRDDVDAYGSKDTLDFSNLVLIARHESDLQIRPSINE